MQICVDLFKWPNRSTPGKIWLQSDTGVAILGPFRCLGKSDSVHAADHGNASRDPLKAFGDLPAGVYLARIEPNPMYPVKTYGKWKPLRLIPTFGDALTAANNGRTGILMHGGAVDPATEDLRPTFGCLRVDDVTMFRILGAMDAAGITDITLTVKEK